MGSLKKLVDEIDKTYWSEPKKAKQRIEQLIQIEIKEQITNSNLSLIREFTNGIRLLVSHHKNKITDTKTQQ